MISKYDIKTVSGIKSNIHNVILLDSLSSELVLSPIKHMIIRAHHLVDDLVS
jgi:hypothetical protein